MKIIPIIGWFLMLSWLPAISGAQTPIKMRLHMKSGIDTTFDMDSVAKMGFTSHPDPPFYTHVEMMQGHPPNWNEPYFHINEVDSMTFERVSARPDTVTLTVWASAIKDTFRSYVLPRYPDPIFPVTSIDSIVFGRDTVTVDTELTVDFPAFHQVYQSVVWFGNKIYATFPGRRFTLDVNDSIVGDTIFEGNIDSLADGRMSLALNTRGDRLLSVASDRWGFSGWLLEKNLTNGDRLTIDTLNVSSAVFCPGTDSVLYYSYGDYTGSLTAPANAGYYLFDPHTSKKTLLLHYMSSLGVYEYINGFDVSPDGKKLLLGSVANERPPLVVEYDLQVHTFDTLFRFDTTAPGGGLWVRYSHDGSKILYSNYLFAFSYNPADTGEVGIIDRNTRSKRVLNMCVSCAAYQMEYLVPQWSPDDTQIIFLYGAVSKEPPGDIQWDPAILKKLRFW